MFIGKHADGSRLYIKLVSKSILINFGKSIAIFEMVSVSKPNFTETNVHTTSAIICEGIIELIFFGVKNKIKSVNVLKIIQFVLISERFKIKLLIPSVMEGFASYPIKGFNCISINIVPTPFVKPDITGYGTYFTISGASVNEIII